MLFQKINRLSFYLEIAQVWLFLGVSSVVIIGTMSWFSSVYSRTTFKKSNTIHQDKDSRENGLKRKPITYENKLAGKMIDSISFYTLYAANILTNHGKIFGIINQISVNRLYYPQHSRQFD